MGHGSYAYNLTTGEVQVGQLGVQGHPWLFSKFEANLAYIKPCPKGVEVGNLGQQPGFYSCFQYELGPAARPLLRLCLQLHCPRRDQGSVSELLLHPGCAHPEPGSMFRKELWNLLSHQQNLGRRGPSLSSVLLPLYPPTSHPLRDKQVTHLAAASGLAGAPQSSNNMIPQRKMG